MQNKGVDNNLQQWHPLRDRDQAGSGTIKIYFRLFLNVSFFLKNESVLPYFI